MKKKFDKNFKFLESQIDDLIYNFEKGGILIKDSRNKLKKYNCGDIKIVVKSFKTPNIFNKIIYKFFRKGKAERSFEYARKLMLMGIKTPRPIAFYEEKTSLFLKRSFYISEYINYDFTIREVINNLELAQNKKIIRAFTKFTFKLHENKINFLDHSPGNTLIKFEEDKPVFYLVDINRMKFENMKISKRLANFSRISKKSVVIRIIAKEYSNLSGLDYEFTFNCIWNNILKFRYRFNLKKRFKNNFLVSYLSKDKL